MAIADYKWFPYFEFAAAADTASGIIRAKIDEVAPTIETLGVGMAGDDGDVGRPWGASWDTAINTFLPAACRLADAYGAIANRAYIAGLNFIYSEWVAGGRQGQMLQPPYAAPTNVDQRILIGNLPTVVASNGSPLVTDIPMLIEQIAKDLPNGSTVKLDEIGSLMADLATVIREQTDAVRKYGREPGSRDSRDAHLLYDEYVSNVLGPSGMMASDANTLARAALTFSQQLTKQRADMKTEMDNLVRDGSITLAVGVLGTVVTATGSDWVALGVTSARVTTTALRIRNLVEVIQIASRTVTSSLTELRVSTAVVRLMLDTIEKTGIDIEIDPETGVRKMLPVFPKWKQEAWERYQIDCVNRRGGCMTQEEWSRAYDQLMENSSKGSEWDREVAVIMGYTDEDGWKSQQQIDDVPSRRYDFVHYNEFGEPDELVENKSGRLDSEQLQKDEGALENGYRVTYNLKTEVTPSQQAELDRLKAAYGDRFTVNYHYK